MQAGRPLQHCILNSGAALVAGGLLCQWVLQGMPGPLLLTAAGFYNIWESARISRRSIMSDRGRGGAMGEWSGMLGSLAVCCMCAHAL
jgi:hypothetical protein